MANKNFYTQRLHDSVQRSIDFWMDDIQEHPMRDNGSLADAIVRGLRRATRDVRIQQAYMRACWLAVEDHGVLHWEFYFPRKAAIWAELREEWSSDPAPMVSEEEMTLLPPHPITKASFD